MAIALLLYYIYVIKLCVLRHITVFICIQHSINKCCHMHLRILVAILYNLMTKYNGQLHKQLRVHIWYICLLYLYLFTYSLYIYCKRLSRSIAVHFCCCCWQFFVVVVVLTLFCSVFMVVNHTYELFMRVVHVWYVLQNYNSSPLT